MSPLISRTPKVVVAALLLVVDPEATAAAAYQQQHRVTESINRRMCLSGLLGMPVAAICAGQPQAVNALISSKYCASGKGEGCDDLSEGNELIRSLQQKSAANAEIYAEEARNAYYMKNYPDFFATVGKSLVKKPDGGFLMVDDSEMEQLLKDNKIRLEIPKAMGGKVTDLTQKPIMVLKE